MEYKVNLSAKTKTYVVVDAESEEKAKERARDETLRLLPGRWSDREIDILSVEAIGDDEFGIRIPDSASEWQLYSTMSGSKRVAKSMTTQIKRRLKKLPKLVGAGKTVAEAASEVYCDFCDKVLHKYREYGAYDTEPCVEAKSVITKYCERQFGTDGDDLYYKL